MKKFFTEVKRSIFAVVLACFISVSLFSVPAFASVAIDTETADLTYANLEGTPIWFESEISEEEQTAVLLGWYLVPEGLRDQFEKYGCKVYVTTEADPSNEAAATTYAATVSVWSDGEIAERLDDPYVVISDRYENDLTSTILHELGHVFDMTVALCESGTYDGSYYELSDSETWQTLYATYCETIKSYDYQASYCCEDVHEAFVEMFRAYCESPRVLLEMMPEVYLYIDSCINQYT